jgi:putative flippase GtrA
MRLVRLLPRRVRHIVPEAMAFATIGLANTLLYFVIFNVTMGIGAVKATVIATVVTTTLSYLANRHWTYKNRPKSALRREYLLFFAFNLAGMVIQSGIVAFAKYGIGLNESSHRLAFNIATCIGIGLATAFRFWSYRTMVFLPAEPADAVPAQAAAALAAAPQPRSGRIAGLPANGTPVDDPIGAELAGINDPLDVELEAELAAAELASADLDGGAGHRPA